MYNTVQARFRLIYCIKIHTLEYEVLFLAELTNWIRGTVF